MDPKKEAALKAKLSIILPSLAATARLFTMNDPALGLVIQQAALDITGVHWDRYKNLYDALKAE